MIEKSYKNIGKFLLSFSIISSLIIIFLKFKDGNFIENLNNVSMSNSIMFTSTCILLIFSGFIMKNRYPHYYKYQISSAVILLATTLLFDIIPRIIYL